MAATENVNVPRINDIRQQIVKVQSSKHLLRTRVRDASHKPGELGGMVQVSVTLQRRNLEELAEYVFALGEMIQTRVYELRARERRGES